MFEGENPHRLAANKHAVYLGARNAKTVRQAKEAGASLWDLKEWVKKGAIKIDKPPDCLKPSQPEPI